MRLALRLNDEPDAGRLEFARQHYSQLRLDLLARNDVIRTVRLVRAEEFAMRLAGRVWCVDWPEVERPVSWVRDGLGNTGDTQLPY